MTTGDAAVSPRRSDHASTALASTADIVVFAAVVCAAALIGWIAASATSGLVPQHNALFGADTGRVLSDLTGETDKYYRLKVHPWQGWICVFYQFVVARLLGLPPQTGVPALSVLIAAVCAGLLYTVLRRLDVGRWASASAALLFCSTGGYVFWSTVPETHMAGGLSTLVAVLLMTGNSPSTAGARFWRSVFALTAGFSMVVTNAAVWLLGQIEFERVRRQFFKFNASKFAKLWPQAACSVGLVFLVWAPQWLFLQKRIGIPFNFLEEHHYVDFGSQSVNWSLHAVGLVPPGSVLSVVLSLAGICVLIAALRLLKVQLRFIPLFPLFGIALHAVYGSESAFLFSPNYLPLFIVSVALVAKKVVPRFLPAATLAAAAMLLVFNMQQWQSQLHALDAAGQLKTYQAAVRW